MSAFCKIQPRDTIYPRHKRQLHALSSSATSEILFRASDKSLSLTTTSLKADAAATFPPTLANFSDRWERLPAVPVYSSRSARPGPLSTYRRNIFPHAFPSECRGICEQVQDSTVIRVPRIIIRSGKFERKTRVRVSTRAPNTMPLSWLFNRVGQFPDNLTCNHDTLYKVTKGSQLIDIGPTIPHRRTDS